MNKPEGLDEIIKSEPLKRYGLKFAGIGAEKICFETEGSTRKLVKVSYDVLRNKIVEMLTGSEDKIVSISEKEEKKIDEDIAQEKVLAEVFGDDHVIKKSAFRFSVPVTKEIALKVLDDNEKSLVDDMGEDEVFEVEMLVETQLIAEELKDREVYKTKYIHLPLMIYDQFIQTKDISLGLKKIEELIERKLDSAEESWITEDRYIEASKEIVQKIIQYTKKTGKVLDIVGPDNITVFINKGGKSDFHLLDAIPPGKQKRWSRNIKDDEGLKLLRHSYTYFYGVNCLAKKLGISETLDMEDMSYFKGSEIPIGEFPNEKV